jgi:hypothetical protein
MLKYAAITYHALCSALRGKILGVQELNSHFEFMLFCGSVWMIKKLSYINLVGFEILMAVRMKMAVFWDVAPSKLV